MRLGVTSFHWNVDQAAIARTLIVSDNRVRPEEICDYLVGEAKHGPFAAVFIDTWQAFFDGKDANHPTDAVDFTRRFRPLTRLPGGPAVVIAAHPVKRASNEDLLPYGGGSILNEVDGNLTLAPQPCGLIELGWQGKFRDLGFEPPLYRMEHLMSPDIVDTAGRQVAIPVMLPATVEDAEARETGIVYKDTRLLRVLADNPSGYLSTWSAAAGINRSKANRTLHKLAKEKPSLTRQTLGKWTLTKAGKEALAEPAKGETTVSGSERNGE
jgi:hypothetical protein